MRDVYARFATWSRANTFFFKNTVDKAYISAWSGLEFVFLKNVFMCQEANENESD